MLANLQDGTTSSGTLGTGVHLSSAFLYELLEFIASNLPAWRDDPERPQNSSETILTEHLCDHLTSVARKSDGWDILQFRTEAADEVKRGRKVDVAPKPCGTVLWIDGRRYTQYEPLLPIECKRLPTPAGPNRDEREYVFNRQASTGGIQRFKAGDHGAAHTLGAIIGYIQQETMSFWDERVREWINGMISSGVSGWTLADLLHLEHDDKGKKLTVFRSVHTRVNGLKDIELRHLWLNMN